MTAHPTPERLSAFLDGETAGADAAAVEAHVRGCAECRAWLDDMRALEGVVDQTLPRPPADYFETFGARLQPRLAPRRRSFVRPWMAAAAAAAVLAVVVPALRVAEKSAAPPAAVPRGPDGAGGGAPAPATAPAPAADELAKQPRADRETTFAESPREQAPAASRGRVEQPPAAPAPAAPAATIAPEAQKLDEDVPAREEKDAEGFADAPAPKRRAEPPPGAPAPAAAAATDSAEERGADLARSKTESAPKAVGGLAAGSTRALTADEARARREAARRRAAASEGAAADAARVEIVEMGVQAWRVSGSEEDRRQALADAEAYLRWPGARRGPRVRALRDELRR